MAIEIFSATNGLNGTELWRTDGTAAGTVMIKDIYVAPNGVPNTNGYSSNPTDFTAVGNQVFFRAYDGTGSGESLWTTNGLTSGTTKLTASSVYNVSNLTNFNGALYFTAYDPTFGYSLFKSNGTAAGTSVVKGFGSSFSSGQTIKVLGGKMYFTGYDSSNGSEPWVSDGTAAGTVLLKDIYGGSNGSSPTNFTAAGSKVYFTAYDTTAGTELWVTNGTATGTTRVADLYSGTNTSSPSQMIALGSKLLFSAYNGSGSYLYITDGVTTTALTTTANGSAPSYLTVLGSTALFVGYDSTHGAGLFSTDGTTVSFVKAQSVYTAPVIMNGKVYYYGYDNAAAKTGLIVSDGTTAGTTLVKDFGFGFSSSFQNPVVVGSKFFFESFALDGTTGTELWVSDGTMAGTGLVKDIYPGQESANPEGLTSYNGKLLFSATEPGGGRELYVSDGTSAGTTLVKDINSTFDPATSLSMSNATAVGSKLFFNGYTPTYGSELYVSDGTASGTKLVGDLYAGSGGSNPNQLISVNGKLLFSASYGSSNFLHSSDGTTITQLSTTANAGSPSYLFSLGSKAIFYGYDTSHGAGLFSTDGTTVTFVKNTDYMTAAPVLYNGLAYYGGYDSGTSSYGLIKSDGTAAGTTLVKGLGFSNTVRNATVLGSKIYFTQYDSATGDELYVSDGTTAGTGLLKDIYVGISSSNATNLTAVGTKVFFTANDAAAGNEVWVTDGTDAGTTRVTDIVVGTNASNPSNLTALGGKLLFNAYDGRNTFLYATDGTTTTQLTTAENGGSASDDFTSLGSVATFTGYDQPHGTGLFATDGTTVTFLKNTYNYSSSRQTVVFNGKEYFNGYDSATNTYGLFVTDGTASGTTLVKAFPYSYNDPQFKVVGTKLYFQARDNTNGIELWATDGTVAGTVMLSDTRTANSSNATGLTLLPNVPPEIAGVGASTQTTDKMAARPFASTIVTDADAPSQTLYVAVSLDPVKGSLSGSGGTYNAATGVYSLSGTAAQVTTALQALAFTPTPNRVAPGAKETTAIALGITDGVAPLLSASTSVVTTSVNDSPVVVADFVSATQRTSVGGSVLANDSDLDATDTFVVGAVAKGGTTLTVTASGTGIAGLYGTLAINTAGAFSYAASAEGLISIGQTVLDTFSYAAFDRFGGGSATTLTFSVTGSPTGNAGSNTFLSSAGNDAIDGRAGADMVIYSGAWSAYAISRSGDSWRIADGRTGAPDGTDTLLNIETVRFGDGSVLAFDTDNANWWQYLITTTRSDGRVSHLQALRDNGKTWSVDYDLDNTTWWTSLITETRADGRAELQQAVKDDGGQWKTTYDLDNTAPWQFQTEVSRPDGRLELRQALRDDGGNSVTNYDLDNTTWWRSLTTEARADGRVEKQQAVRDDGTGWKTSYDLDNGTWWQSLTEVSRTDGRVELQQALRDDGGQWKTTYDLDNTTWWTSLTEVSRTDGRVELQQALRDDGKAWKTSYDVDNTTWWTSLTEVARKDGRTELQQALRDDGNTFTATYDLDDQFAWTVEAIVRDPSGVVLSTDYYFY